MILYTAFLGALMNKIRGGILTDLMWSVGRLFGKDWTKSEVPLTKTLNDLVFAGAFTCVISGGSVYTLDALYMFIALFLSMMIGNRFGWGSYINGMFQDKIGIDIRKQISWIDNLVFPSKSHPDLRNCLALSLRGLMWTLPLTIAFWICSLLGFYIAPTFVWIFPLGLLMGFVYLFTTNEIIEHSGWAWGEILWGYILWGACAALI